jgi:hypothetical protein
MWHVKKKFCLIMKSLQTFHINCQVVNRFGATFSSDKKIIPLILVLTIINQKYLTWQVGKIFLVFPYVGL